MSLTSNKKITAVLFDVGGVLLKKLRDIDEQICDLLKLEKTEFTQAQTDVISTDAELIEEWKHINTLPKEVEYLNKFYSRVFERMGANKTPTEIQIATICQVKRGYRLKEGAYEILEYLADKYSLGMVTNSFASRRYFEIVDYDLGRFFKAIVISREIDSDKPSEKIFLETLKLMHVPASEAVLIDDKEKNLAAAKKLGFGELVLLSKSQNQTTSDGSYLHISKLTDLKELL